MSIYQSYFKPDLCSLTTREGRLVEYINLGPYLSKSQMEMALEMLAIKLSSYSGEVVILEMVGMA